MNEITIKTADLNIEKELVSIGFDSSYSDYAKNKYKGNAYKLFNLKPHEANILKQICLSLGFDCAVSRDTVTCKCEYTNALIFASSAQLKLLVDKLQNQPFRLRDIAIKISKVMEVQKPVLKIKNKVFDWKSPYIMGILNVTPDSFSDGGMYYSVDDAVKHAIDLINDGADIIDIGGESTRPDAKAVTVNEEIERIIPVIKEIRNLTPQIPISVDTRNFDTAKAAVECGADIINDVSGLDYDVNLYDFVVKNNIPCVIMHSDNVPAISADCTSEDIVEEVYNSLYKKIDKLISDGMNSSNIIADVGIGFGKSMESNYILLKRIREFESLNAALLVGISRKSFIRNKFNVDIDDADRITSLYSAMLNSVNIHRVHNVKLLKQYLSYKSAISD